MAGPDKSFYLDSLRSDADRFLTAARAGSQAPLPSVAGCPDWNTGQLLIHLGGVHRHVAHRVRNHQREFESFTEEELGDILALEPRFLDWLEEWPENEPMPPELLTWFQEGASNLAAALEAADPDEPIGTWFTPNQTAGFWQRRMAQETAVHRWDAEAAVGTPEPIEATLARDGIDEVMDVMLPMRREWLDPRPSNGESYHFHRTDGEGEWLVRFNPDDVAVSREHGRADVALRGSASDLLLFLWGRVPADRLSVAGDAALLDRFFELVPPD